MAAKKSKKKGAKRLGNLPARGVGAKQARSVKGGMRKAGGDPQTSGKTFVSS